jgi:hypothetical protein
MPRYDKCGAGRASAVPERPRREVPGLLVGRQPGQHEPACPVRRSIRTTSALPTVRCSAGPPQRTAGGPPLRRRQPEDPPDGRCAGRRHDRRPDPVPADPDRAAHACSPSPSPEVSPTRPWSAIPVVEAGPHRAPWRAYLLPTRPAGVSGVRRESWSPVRCPEQARQDRGAGSSGR